MTKTTFAQWTQAELARCFGLHKHAALPELNSWLAEAVELPDDTKRLLQHLRGELEQRGDSWNEEELKLSFIGPLIALVDYNTDDIGFFAGRTLTATIGDYELCGVPDGLVARGIFEPEKPYFCLHEYKRELGQDRDPRGQVLAAMLTAQKRNEDNVPIYGAYVLGRIWFFLVLCGCDYAVSNSYSATKDEILDIYRILSGLKKLISTA